MLRLKHAGSDAERAHEQELLQLTDEPIVRLRQEISTLRLAEQAAAVEKADLERQAGLAAARRRGP